MSTVPEAPPIARIWIGHTRHEHREEYAGYVQRTGIAGYRSTHGNRGAYLLVRDLPDRTEFLTLSFWDSWEAIRAFAGEDPERARYYAEDERYLLDFPDTVRHYEARSGGRGGAREGREGREGRSRG